MENMVTAIKEFKNKVLSFLLSYLLLFFIIFYITNVRSYSNYLNTNETHLINSYEFDFILFFLEVVWVLLLILIWHASYILLTLFRKKDFLLEFWKICPNKQTIEFQQSLVGFKVFFLKPRSSDMHSHFLSLGPSFSFGLILKQDEDIGKLWLTIKTLTLYEYLQVKEVSIKYSFFPKKEFDVLLFENKRRDQFLIDSPPVDDFRDAMKI